MSNAPKLRRESLVDPQSRWGLGRTHLGVLQPEPQLASQLHSSSPTPPIHVIFHGDLDNETELASSLSSAGERVDTNAAAVVRALYRRHGRGVAPLLKGAFTAAVLDTSNHQLLLISDRLGSYPLYWFLRPDGILFASELRAALRAHPKPSLDARGFADFLKFDFPMGNRTLISGAELVPQSATLLYRGDQHAVSVEPYGSIAELFQPHATNRNEYTESVCHAFDGAMTRATRGTVKLALSLSGGLDTRVILSALDRMGRSAGIHTFTLGGRGCADEVIGYQLARMARTHHRFDALDDHYLEDLMPSLRPMVSLTDGMYVSHGFTEMLALGGFDQTDATLLLRGHCGELAKASTAWPFHTDARINAMRSVDEFVPYLLSRVTHVSRGSAAHELLTANFVKDLDGGADASLRDTVSGVELSPADLCSYIYLKEYHRRVTIPSLEIFRSSLEVRLPLADVDYVRTVLSGPAQWRDGVALHQAIIAANNRSYLRIRNPNTGAPAGAGPMTEFVLDKMNTILRRLNVYGYRHYHSFDGWMRRALLKLVDDVLLAPQTLDRGVFTESALREKVTQARQGVQAHDDLLQALVIVELWFRSLDQPIPPN